MSSPTYGTGTRADAQLLSDVTGMFSLKPPEKEHIDYKPRPALVTPAPGEKETLPPPQESIVTASNGQWPESPEQRRARLRDEATLARDTGTGSPIIDDVAIKSGGGITSAARLTERGNFESVDTRAQRDAFNKKLAETKQGSPTTRKYLSEPPLVYREPAATAPTGDVGEDEWKKERRQKKAAQTGRTWRDYIPGL